LLPHDKMRDPSHDSRSFVSPPFCLAISAVRRITSLICNRQSLATLLLAPSPRRRKPDMKPIHHLAASGPATLLMKLQRCALHRGLTLDWYGSRRIPHYY